MDNNTIEQLLSSLTALVGDARGTLFGQERCTVDREQLLYIVDALKNQIPAEIGEAKTIIENCNILRTNAKKDAAETRKEADRVLQEAEARAARLVEESAIVEHARQQEKEILENARQQKAMLIDGAVHYADRIMEEAQRVVEETYEALRMGTETLQKQAEASRKAAAEQITEARTALQNAIKDAK